MSNMETKQIINWLRDKAIRSGNHSWERMMFMAAKRLEELDKPQETAHWIVHITSDDIYAECSNCLTCGSPQWKVCPVCERKMVKVNAED